MVKNVSIKIRGGETKKKNKHKTTKTKRAAQLKLKRNSQLRNCRRTSFVSISFIYIFFFTFRFCYKLCRLLYCQVINSNNNSDRTAASESLGTKAKGINYREWEFLNSFLWVFIASDPAFFPYWSVGKFVPRLSIINIFHLAYFYSVSLISWLKYNIYTYVYLHLQRAFS